MKIKVYAIAWNEEYYIPFFIRHYKRFFNADICIFDQHSTDATARIAKNMGAEVVPFGGNTLNDQDYLNIKNNLSEKSKKYDFIIVCDIDEFLYHPDAMGYLFDCRLNGITIPLAQGYNMVSNELPALGYLHVQIRTGYTDDNYSKTVIFDPVNIKNINFTHGCHVSRPVGHVVYSPTREFRLLHFRCIGGAERLVNRHLDYQRRMSKFNREYNLGHHYLSDSEAKRQEFKEMLRRATDFI